MTFDIAYSVMMLVFLPLLVIQTRMLLYKRIESERDAERRPLLETLLEQLPHDLAIIGMTLGFASFAITRGNVPGPFDKTLSTVFLVIPFVPFYFMTVIPMLRDKRFRLALGLSGYFVGVAAFLLSRFVGQL